MTEYVIEKDVPIPPTDGRGGFFPKGSGFKGALSRMQVGESLLVTCEKDERAKRRNVVSATSRLLGKETGTKFTIRTVEGGIRVWRVS